MCIRDRNYDTPHTSLSVWVLLDEGTFFMLSLIHISEPTRRYAISYAVFCLKKGTLIEQYPYRQTCVRSVVVPFYSSIEPFGKI